MSDLKISFVVPTLNQAPFICRCIDSCLAQQLETAELLVQDGGSTDGTQHILAEYGSRVNLVSARDDGQSDAVNRAISRASGGGDRLDQLG